MKRALVGKIVLFISLVALAGCDDAVGSNNGGVGNNGNNNGVNNGGPNNGVGDGAVGAKCVVSTDCNSGLCQGGLCQKAGDDSCDGSGQCGDCDDFCNRDDIGGPKNPFKLGSDDEDSTDSGVVLDDDGAITLDVRRIETNFIWIANTDEGTISKVDTRTLKEVARYLTGPKAVGISREQGGNDPSRTSVNTFSDVYVGNRDRLSVTKISALGNECPDRNNDGMKRTSQGPSDVLPWGEDDCIIWNTPLPGGGVIRAVAAQDGFQENDTIQPGVWVGGWNGKIWKLSSENGAIELTTNSPVGGNYGFALDGLGNLWISGWSGAAIGRINTLKCIDSATCDAEVVCDREDGDTCVKQRIALPHRPYGITVDFKQRVWTGGDATSVYDPKKPVGQRFTHTQIGFTHGIAADEKGFIWISGMTAGLFRMDAENPASNMIVPGTEQSSKGVAVDLDGKIWSINRSHSSATVVTPGPNLADNDVQTEIVKNLVTPYTYSDMTGAQLRFATDELGYYRRTFEGCTASNVPETFWSEVRWDTLTPGDTKVVFRARAANIKADLQTANWISIATVTPDTSPKDISQLFDDAGIQGFQFVELEAQLQANRKADNSIDVPKLKAMAITFRCPIVVQ